ncbi:MAG: hypothetical protein AAF713_04595 [Pseudomonadota bacterium]
MILTRQELGAGGYLYTARPVSPGPGREVRFLSAVAHAVYSTVPKPAKEMILTVADDRTREDTACDNDPGKDSGDASAGQGVSTERAGKIPGEIRTELLTGGGLIIGTHLATKGPPALAAQAVSHHLGLGSDPASLKGVGQLLSGNTGAANQAGTIGDVLKIAFFALMLFGIGFKILELIFGKQAPAWAVVTMALMNTSLIVCFGLFVTETGPFALPADPVAPSG